MPNPLRASAEASSLLSRLAGQAEAPKYIRAYHGSPHDFDRFDASKIGSGEGAQSFGHGLYFAGSEPVADVYRTSVSALHRTPQEDALEFWRRHAEISGNKQKAVLDALDHAEGSLDEAAGMPEAEQRWRDIIQHLYELDFRQPLPKRPGHMYEVELGVPESALLDYDRPFSTPTGAMGAAVLRQDNPAALTESTLRGIQDGSWRMESFPFSNPYEKAGIELLRLAKTPGGAQALMAAGIPGVRYLDQGSRSAGAGTRNYVMFPGTEDSIRILRKYAVPGAIGAGAATVGASQQ